MKRNIPIYRKEMALELEKRGFKCVDEKPNYKEKGKVVFFFEDCDEIYEVISELSNKLGRSIFKVSNLEVAQELIKLGYELIDINTTGKPTRIFKWKKGIHEDKQRIKEQLYEKKRNATDKKQFIE